MLEAYGYFPLECRGPTHSACSSSPQTLARPRRGAAETLINLPRVPESQTETVLGCNSLFGPRRLTMDCHSLFWSKACTKGSNNCHIRNVTVSGWDWVCSMELLQGLFLYLASPWTKPCFLLSRLVCQGPRPTETIPETQKSRASQWKTYKRRLRPWCEHGANLRRTPSTITIQRPTCANPCFDENHSKRGSWNPSC